MMQIKPNVLFNNKRKRWTDDYLIGANSDYYNEILKYLKVNATLVESTEFGSCKANGTCSGLYSLLQTGQADFSLLGLSYAFSPDVPISSTEPFIHGPLEKEISILMLSLPMNNGREINLHVLQTFKEIPPYLYFVFWFLFLLILVIVKCPLFKTKRVSMFHMISNVLNNKSIPRPHLIHSFLAMSVFLLLVLLTSKIIMVFFKCDLMRISPNEYYQSLEHLVQGLQAGRAQAYCFRNLRTASQISSRSEPVYKKLASFIKHVQLEEIKTIVGWMIDKRAVFLATQITSSIVQSVVCRYYRRSYTELEQSKSFLSYFTSLAMSKNINPQLRTRVHNAFNIVFEKAIASHYDERIKKGNLARLEIPENTIAMCELMVRYKRYNEKLISPAKAIDLRAFEILFKFQLFFCTIACILLVLELFVAHLGRCKKRHDLRRNKSAESVKNIAVVDPPKNEAIYARKSVIFIPKKTNRISPTNEKSLERDFARECVSNWRVHNNQLNK